MAFLTDALDTLKGYGGSIAATAGSTLKGVADASVQAINDNIANAGKPRTAVPETHNPVPTGQTSNGSTVIPMPATPAAQVAAAAAAAGMPTWALVLLSVSAVAVVGGGVYWAVAK